MKKAVGFIGVLGASRPGSRDNTGNTVHGHAARDLFAEWKDVSDRTDDANVERIRASVTHIGFVAATMLHARVTPDYVRFHATYADFIEKLDLPVVVFGFGCQAGRRDTVASANVDERSVRLLRVMAERAASIGVRGAFTADLCAKYGVKNVEVVGCQSAYIAALLNADKRELKTRGDRPAINLSQNPDERPLLRMGMAAGAGIIGQGNPTEEAIAQGALTRDEFVNAGAWPQLAPFVRNALAEGHPGPGAYFDYIAANFHKFYTVPEWRAFMAEHYDFSLGTRFHGNMAALQAGVPSTWIMHDLRTEELCAHFGLPSVKQDRVAEFTDIRQLAEACSYETFWKTMPGRVREFQGYLAKNGLTDLLAPWVRQGLEKLAA